ncbi:hypothetical protein Cri9333_0378 [Crinalium epipsammum PCC 9333]|uniref:Uncharacterized protein n=1 Tax=Crinalium epipsammum PCC 9333 TaxID=1173022 RepID=K9VTF4_9CYAN|nr:hypothetical protein Cri9333_0378 [Crinalium epipsammum PCC 9333]
MIKINLSYRFHQLDSLTTDTCRKLKYASQKLYKQTVDCFLKILYFYSHSRKLSGNKFRKLVAYFNSQVCELDSQLKKAFSNAPITRLASQYQDFVLDLSGGIQLEFNFGI